MSKVVIAGGFSATPWWILDLGLSANALKLWVFLWREGFTCPEDENFSLTYEYLEGKMGDSKSTIRRSLEELKENDVVRVEQDSGPTGIRGNIYSLAVAPGVFDLNTPACSPVNTPRQQGKHIKSPGGSTCSPVNTPSFNKSKKEGKSSLGPPKRRLPTPEQYQEWCLKAEAKETWIDLAGVWRDDHPSCVYPQCDPESEFYQGGTRAL